MSLAISDEHVELERVVRSFLTDRGVLAGSRALLEAPSDELPTFWTELATIGWLGLAVAEEFGGSGFGLDELTIVLYEMGRQVTPGPFLPTVTASTIVDRLGTDSQRERLLPGFVDGTRVGAFAVGPQKGSLGKGSHAAVQVLGGEVAGVTLVTVGPDVVILENSKASDHGRPNLDPTRRVASVLLNDLALSDENVIFGGALEAIALARILGAAEAAGGADDCVLRARDYALEREQFGRVIGTFQAVKHHIANMLVGSELAASAVWMAARASSGARQDRSDQKATSQLRLAAAVAVQQAFPAFLKNAQTCIQIHGGIGFTWEQDSHLYLRRAAALNALFEPAAAATEVATLCRSGVKLATSIDLPVEAEAIRLEVRHDAERLQALSDEERLREIVETGYVQPHWPRPWGRAATAVEQLVIEEEFAEIERPNYGIGTWIILTLIQHGTEDQIARWIRPSLEGKLVWCQLFSEPAAGSDAAGIRTRGTRVEGGWLVNGQKVWTSGAQFCNRGFATVRTDPDAGKHAGITMMVVDLEAKGVDVRPLRDLTGGETFNEVFFDDVFVADEDVVGPVDSGWTVARSTLGNERVSIGSGMFRFGEGVNLLQLANDAAQTLPGMDRSVGSLLSEELAMQALNLRGAQRAVAGAAPGPEGNVAKLLSAEHAQRVADLALDLAGGSAVFLDGEAGSVGQLLLYSRGLSIAGGTSEITRNQIAERILKLPRDPLQR